MTPHEKHQKIRAARQRLHAQRIRAGELRGRVVIISLITFVLLWGVVFVQMATGNDPVLSRSSRALAASGHNRGHETESHSAIEEPVTEQLGGESGTVEEIPIEEVPIEEEAFEEAPIEEEEAFEAAPVEEELAPLTTSQS
jgi:hypothetical protein